MKCNSSGIQIIKSFESLKLKAYLCPAGIPTIGWGHTKGITRQMVTDGYTITLEKAEQLFQEDLREAESAVTRLVKEKLTDNEFSALTSFVFNIGETKFSKSTLLRKLNVLERRAAVKEFERWIYSNGKPLQGLIRRRQAEKELFLRG